MYMSYISALSKKEIFRTSLSSIKFCKRVSVRVCVIITVTARAKYISCAIISMMRDKVDKSCAAQADRVFFVLDWR